MASKPLEYLKRGVLKKTVYVISRIKDLSAELTKLAEEKNYDVFINNICLPVHSDVIPSKDIYKAVIAVIDPKLLAVNYKNMPYLNWAYCTWAGVEPLFEGITEKPKFVVTRHSGDDFCDQMGQFILGQILSYEGNFKHLWEGQRERSWYKMLRNWHETRSLKDLNVGILGVGNMGRSVAKHLKPHGTNLIGFALRTRSPEEFGHFDKIVTSLEEILEWSDYIINTLPSTRDTKGLLNGCILSSCTKKPVFINVGRASLIDEEELLHALSQKWLTHAIIDVFEQEPLPPDNLLWDKVTVTPHIAALSRPNFIAKDFLDALKIYESYKPLPNEVNWDAGY